MFFTLTFYGDIGACVGSFVEPKINGYNGTQVIDLQSGTKVTGSITVDSGKGEIWISSNSEILSTQVFRAQIYKK